MDKTTYKVSILKPFLSSFLALIKDKEAIAELEELIKTFPEADSPPKKVNSINTKLNKGREIRRTAQIGDYDMDCIILDLGSDVNILTC